MFVTLYLPTIPTQALDTLYIYLEVGAAANATITGHIWLTLWCWAWSKSIELHRISMSKSMTELSRRHYTNVDWPWGQQHTSVPPRARWSPQNQSISRGHRPSYNRKWCLEASRRKTPGNALRHHVGICMGMPQGIMRSERVKSVHLKKFNAHCISKNIDIVIGLVPDVCCNLFQH